MLKKDFLTEKFKILQKISISGNEFRYKDEINLSKNPVYGVIKFNKSDHVNSFTPYEFTNNEVWLLIFSKKYNNYLITLIDDGFDDFVYESKDFEIDRIGIIINQGYKRIPFENLGKTIEFKLMVKGKEITHSISHANYINHFKNAFRELKAEKNEFIPFDNTYTSSEFDFSNNKKNSFLFLNKNSKGWSIIFYKDRFDFIPLKINN